MNITFDDTSPYLTFSDEWRVQPPNDEAAKGFWQGTYHAAQTKGARVTVTFNGAGIYLFGSKSPGSSKYSVEIDNRIYFFDAKSSSTQYQQQLYGDTMRQGAHTLVFTHEGTDGGDEGWLDIDYIMVTSPLPDGVSSQSNPGSFPTSSGFPGGSGGSTGSPPAAYPTNSGSVPVPIGSDPSRLGSDSDDETDVTKIVAIVLGVLLALVLLAVLAFFVYRRLTKKKKVDQDFRYGTTTGSTHMAPQPTMHSRSTGVYSGIAVPMSPNATAGPFATPPGSHIAHAPTRSATSSPGPSVLQIGRSVALLDTTGDPGAVSFPRAHSSLSHNTAFSGNSYAITPEGAFAAQPASRSGSFDALRETLHGSPGAVNNRQSVLSNSSAIPVGIATASGAPSSWLNQPPEVKSKGKEWKAQGGAGQRQTRTWNPSGGAPSIKTFVQVMDE